jgi:MATE family multidrug resistance protein
MATQLATAAPLPAASLRAEIRATAALALPLALTQLGQIAINTTDVIVLGRLSAEALAAAALAIALFHVILVSCIGVVMATSPLVAQALGGGRPLRLRRTVRQGLWVALAISVPCLVLLWFTSEFLELIGQDPVLAANAETLMHALMWSLPFALGLIVVRNFVTAFERTAPVVAVMLTGVVVNALLNWVLVFGHLGFPALGLTGSGLASTLVNLAMFVALSIYAAHARPYRRYAVFGRLAEADWPVFRDILKLGLPIGGTLLLEVGLFAGAAFLMGWIGPAQVAAHQIAIQIASTSFMVPLGVSMAATVRVGLAAGAGDMAAARRAGFVACAMGVAFMGGCGVLFWLAPDWLVSHFLHEDDPAAPAVLALAAGFLRIAAVFQLVDGLQVIAMGALRGIRDTRVPLIIAGFGYWLIGFPACLILGFGLDLGGYGIWTGLAIGLIAVGLPLAWRFHRLCR